MSNQQTTNDIDQFVDRLVAEKGLQDLDPEVLKQLKSDLGKRVEDRINAAILTALPEASLDEFDRVLDTGDQSAIQAFCQSHIPNLQELIAGTLLRFRDMYLG